MADYKRFGLYEGSDRGSQIGTAITFLFIGLGIGAVSALLFAPHSGDKTRKIIRRKYEDAVDSVEDWAEQAADMWEKGKDSVSDLRDRGSEMARKAAEKVAPMAKAIRRD
ncbi:MAG TPA: YtxH domain-containing protein [Terriglobales bacterium]|nr:YtxH domain-containing protein [Terriglobales bacterium]